MITFFIGLAILIGGYFTYGKFVEKVFAPDDRPTPAIKNPDGIDRLVLPNWKNMLVQLLNIAGIGPVIGVILGIKFGPIVFIILPLGCVLGGAVHDFFAGMVSMRNNGANVPLLARKFLGKKPSRIIMIFNSLALLLIGAVFVNTPAQLIDTPTIAGSYSGLPVVFWISVAVIFAYYFVSTFFPVDKIIGKIYPVFGGLLIIASVAILIGIIPNLNVLDNISLTNFFSNFTQHPNGEPIIPMLFVTIACGIISGFHSTQSPIVARTEASEFTGRRTFYGMMIVEGLIGMIWAAGGMFIYHQVPELLHSGAGVKILNTLVTTVLPFKAVSVIVIIGVVILAITSGDTALRSLRLTIAELLNVEQVSVRNRLLICVPMFLLCAGIIWWSNTDPNGFKVLWNYFSWSNQVMAVFSLAISTVYLASKRKNFWITLLPCMFMTFIVSAYILWVSPDHLKGAPLGFNIEYTAALNIAFLISALAAIGLVLRGHRLAKRSGFKADI